MPTEVKQVYIYVDINETKSPNKKKRKKNGKAHANTLCIQ